jgi:phosphate transport system protein
MPPELPRMAEIVQTMMHQALDAFVARNAAAADAVLARDQEVDELYWGIFRGALALMRSDPQAVDRGTRQIFVAKHYERLADHVTNLAEMVIFMVRGTDVRHLGSRIPRS